MTKCYPLLPEVFLIHDTTAAANPGHYGVPWTYITPPAVAVMQRIRFRFSGLVVDNLREEIAAAFRRHVEQSPQGIDEIAGAMVLFRL